MDKSELEKPKATVGNIAAKRNSSNAPIPQQKQKKSSVDARAISPNVPRKSESLTGTAPFPQSKSMIGGVIPSKTMPA